MDIQFIFIIIVLLFVFWFMGSGFKNVSRFTPVNVPGAFATNGAVRASNDTFDMPSVTGDVYELDSRYNYKYNAPVNPMAMRSTIINSIPVSSELFHGAVDNTNELSYSGGDTQLINIPLQYNSPNDSEVLRSQPILITPYNRLKYSPGPPTNDVYLK